mgnify:FL=1|jgi:lysyl-tRNA synthetase, class II
MSLNSEFEVRKEKLKNMQKKEKVAYAEKFDRDIELSEAKNLEDGKNVSVCGRIISYRDFGKFAFIKLYDINGTLQISISKNELGEKYNEIKKMLDTGDFIGVKGNVYTTKTGEKTVRCDNVTLLSKSLRPLAEKFHGVSDPETIVNQRYLDIISNENSRNAFKQRILILKFLREYLQNNGFVELETPILQNIACGANARPFITHHNSLNEDFYLRIAPELYLKKAVAAGFDKVFEIGKNFRNEGMDSSHLQEFTMIEWYAAYWDYLKNMDFSSELLKYLVGTTIGDLKFDYQGINLDFSKFDKVSYIEEVSNFLNHNILDFEDVNEVKAILKSNNIFTEKELDNLSSMSSIIDLIFKKKIRPYIIQPTIMYDYPSYMVPLARPNDIDSRVLDMFQIIVNSWELAKCYSELVNPIKQREEFEKQMKDKMNGDEEAMELDESFLLAMEHGMPPMSGLGMGIDRLVALLTNSPSLRDVVLFPQAKNSYSKTLRK